MRPINATIMEVIEETPSVRTFLFDVELGHVPGQFVMVWIRGVDEVPMSLSYTNGITVQRVGDATEALFELRRGDSVGLRGPYGNGFTPRNRLLVVAGGVGAAPLASLAEGASEVQTLLGARTSNELVFEDRFASAGEVRVTTDDGTKGHAGFVTDLLDEVDMSDYDGIAVTGPEVMMKKVLDRAVEAGVADRAEFSLHRYFKCGLGVCGSCCIDPLGLRVCADGPVFTGEQLLDSEFGRYMRDPSGHKVRF